MAVLVEVMGVEQSVEHDRHDLLGRQRVAVGDQRVGAGEHQQPQHAGQLRRGHAQQARVVADQVGDRGPERVVHAARAPPAGPAGRTGPWRRALQAQRVDAVANTPFEPALHDLHDR